jgi:hypothetical protein
MSLPLFLLILFSFMLCCPLRHHRVRCPTI